MTFNVNETFNNVLEALGRLGNYIKIVIGI